MSSMIQKWGNSHAVRLPRSIVDQVGLAAGQEVLIEAKGKVITIRPAKTRKRIPIQTLIKGMTPAKNRYPEFEDAPEGREII